MASAVASAGVCVGVFGDVDGIIGFLVRAWSDDPDVVVKRGEGFSCAVEAGEVYVPDFHDGVALPDLVGLPRWRWWRYASFHEALHQRLTPGSLDEAADRVARRVGGNIIPAIHYNGGVYWESTKKLIGHVLNIIEDNRIENIGLRTYKGYAPERVWRKGVARKFREDNPRPDFLHPAEEILDEFRASLLVGVVPSGAYASDVHGYAMRSRGVEEYGEVEDAAAYIVEDIVKKVGLPEYPIIMVSMAGMGVSSANAEAAEGEDPSIGEASEGIRKEFEAIQREGKLLESEEASAAKLVEEGAAGMKGGPGGAIQPVTQWGTSSDWSSLMAGREGDVQRLLTLLKRWQVGWEEYLADYGDDVDPDELLMQKLQGKRKFFIDERLIAPKSELAILADLSGSISGMTTHYLQAVGIIGEALEFVKCKFAVYTFQGNFPHSHLHVVKTTRQRWAQRRKDRLASLSAMGGTPMAAALDWMLALARNEGYKRIVVITDGEPNSNEKCKVAIRRLAQSGISVSMLGFRESASRGMPDLFKVMRGLGRVELITGLDKLPAAFFELIKA